MKKIVYTLSVLALATVAFSSCIKETFPQSSTATAEQAQGSASSLEAAVNGIPAQMAQGYLVYGSQTHEADLAYPSFMMQFTELMGDIFPLGSNTGYDWFFSWNTCRSMSSTTYASYIPWRTLYMFVKSANDVIKAVDPESTNPDELAYLGMGYAYRAFDYYHLMNMYEPVLNKYTDCTAVEGLTVPIVTEQTTEEEAKNNPRATHAAMVEFILSDLDKAEQYLKDYTVSDLHFPSIAVVYGLKAKVYMSDKQYANAEKYARMAIDASPSATPLTQAEWEDPTTGFNTATSAWMWYISYSAENMGNLCNWIGWISAEAYWGYARLTIPGINRWIYDRLPDTDFRKHSWVDPNKYEYYNYKTCRTQQWVESLPAYTSLKFRCVGGDYKTYTVGGVCDVPLMRIEEMYYIEAEAKGLQGNVSAGCEALQAFVSQYRQPDYTCSFSDEASFEDEILFQKRVEFWGEGIAFFDAKRMKAGTKQAYGGTNAPGTTARLNAVGIKPNWNYVIPNSEVSNNTALKGCENPDPTETIKPED
jgi:starch-binding outer membrane protein, SusD/RagB family